MLVCRTCVGRSVTLVSSAKMAEAIEMPFALRTQGGSRYHVLDGVQIPYGKTQFLWGEGKWSTIVKYRDTLQSSVQKKRPNGLRCHLG